MERKSLVNRRGIINDEEVIYTLNIELNNNVVCGARGAFLSSALQTKLSETTVILKDIKTNDEFSIFVTESSFSFTRGYENIDKLLKNV